MRNFAIPQSEYSHPRSEYDITPGLRQIVERSVYTPEVRARLGMAAPAAPAPQLVQRAPAAGGGITATAVAQAVANALAPIVADLESLKVRNAQAVRNAVRRAVSPPTVTRAAVRAAVAGGPGVIVRTVESSAYGGLPTRRRVFSPAQVSRASYGLGYSERPNAPRPAAFASKYQPSSTFATAADRDRYDAGFENRPNGVAAPWLKTQPQVTI